MHMIMLNIAIDAESVYIEFEAPWDNLVGFEHAPSTDEQREKVEAAMLLLKSPEKLFVFDGGDCTVSEVTIEQTMEGAEHHDEESEGEHHDEKSEGESHNDEHHDDEAKEHGDEHSGDADGESHSAVFSQYRFDCADIAALSSLDVQIFKQWEGFEELDVQLIGPSGASSAELSANETSLDLSSIN